MGDYFDRVERQLVQRADGLYSTSAVGSMSIGQRVRGFKATRSLAGIVLGAAGGLVAALIVSLGASPATPDFTVSRGKGRLVTINTSRPSSIAELNRRLAALSIPIRAAEVRPGCVAPVQSVGRGSAPARTLDLANLPVIGRRLKSDRGALSSVRVSPPSRPGQTLLLAVGGSGIETLGELIVGSAPACIRGVRRGHALLGALS